MSDPNPDWHDWHDRYRLEAGSHLVRRLAVVQHALARALDSQPAGPIRVASLCAGQGHDLLGVLEDHRRASDVTAVLVEADERTVRATRDRISQGRVRGGVTVVEGDAGNTSVLADVVPVDVLLLCGLFGNISMADIETTIDATPSLLAPGATVIWTRRSVPTDLTPRIRQRFAKDYLHGDLRAIREMMVGKLDGLSEYDIRRPLTATGTNLLGLIKHLSIHTEQCHLVSREHQKL